MSEGPPHARGKDVLGAEREKDTCVRSTTTNYDCGSGKPRKLHPTIVAPRPDSAVGGRQHISRWGVEQ